MKKKLRIVVPLVVVALVAGSVAFLVMRDIPAPVEKVEKDIDPATLGK